jgi:anti-anti-sigma factor
MMGCRIQHDVEGALDIIRFDGALDTQSFPRLENIFKHLTDDRRHRIILDFSNLDYINSASLGALIGFARKVREQPGGDLKLAGLSTKIAGIVNLLGFDKILKLYDRVEDAIEAFSQTA